MNEKILIPLSIIIAGSLIALGLWWNAPSKSLTDENILQENIPEIKKDFNLESALTSYQLAPINPATDLILGNPTADIFVIEYTDLECPACITYHQHPERKKLLDNYKDNTRVAFVLRHLPLKSLHPGAFQKAAATECIRKLADSKRAFEFSHKILTEKINLNSLLQLASDFGVSNETFKTCLENDTTKNTIETSYQAALNSGINATPSIFVQKKSDGKSFTLKEKMWDSKVVSAIVDYFLNK